MISEPEVKPTAGRPPWQNPPMLTLDRRQVRRLALARAGLLKPEWTELPRAARGDGAAARRACHAIIRRFGYLQLDTVSVAGARSHAIVLLSRLPGLSRHLPEALLAPGEPLFEYWGHEASWIPLDLYPHFAWRRRAFRTHPWWGDIVNRHPKEARDLRRSIRADGPIRSIDMEGEGSRGWWDLKIAKKVATALWSSGELAIRERVNFQRSYDLAERVIPEEIRRTRIPYPRALEVLLLRALAGHGFANAGTLQRTWRLTRRGPDVKAALARLERKGDVVPARLRNGDGKTTAGWIRPADLELIDRLARVRPRRDDGVLLSPFDPLLWERARVAELFAFDQILEIFKPAPQRRYGYYCLPVLAGERLIGRFDLKAHRAEGRIEVRAAHFESGGDQPESADDAEAARRALDKYGEAVELEPVGWRPRGKRRP